MKTLFGGFAAAAAAPGLLGATARRTKQPAGGVKKAVQTGLKDGVQPTLIWDVPAQAGVGGPGAATFAEGKLAYISGTPDGYVTVKDIQTGATLFTAGLLSVGDVTPYILNGLIYSVETFSLVAYNPLLAPHAAPVWNRPVFVFTDVNLIGGKLVFAEIRSDVPDPTNTCAITMLDPATKTVIWSCDTGLSTSLLTTFVPQVIQSGDTILARVDDHVVGIDSETGALRWSQTVGKGYSLTGNAISADADYVYVVSDNYPTGTLHALSVATGQPVWQWSNGNTLGKPVLDGQFIYVTDSSGNLTVLVPGPGTNGQGVPAYAPLHLGGDLTSSPVFIEDGIAYLAGGSTVHAIDLATQGQKSIAYQAGAGAKLIGLENGVCYFSHNSGSNLAAVDMADQLHQFWCESQLMADDYVSPSGSTTDTRPSSTWYRTQVQLVDTGGAPRVNKSVKLSVTDNVTIQYNGSVAQVTPAKPVWLTTDATGELSIAVQATDISCPALQLWGNFMDVQESIVIYPDHDTANKLANITSGELSTGRDYEGNAVLMAGSGGADQLAQAIRQMMGNPASSLTAVQGLADVSSKYTAYPDATTNLTYQPTAGPTTRAYVAAQETNWSIDITNGTVTMSSVASGLQNRLANRGLLGGIKEFAARVVHGAEQVGNLVWQGLKTGATAIATTAEGIYNLTITGLEDALTAVGGVLKAAFGDLKKGWEWLSSTLDWGKILANKDTIKSAVNQWFRDMGSAGVNLINSVEKAMTADFQQAENAIRNEMNTIVTALGGTTTESSQVDHNSPSSWTKLPSKWFSAMRWTTTKVESAMSTYSAGDQVPASFGPFLTTVEKLIADSKSKLAADPDLRNIGPDFDQFLGQFTQLFNDPEQAVKGAVADFVKVIGDVFLVVVQAVYLLLDDVLKLLPSLFGAVADLLNAPLSMPGISLLWRAISRDPLTLLDLTALMIAIPATIIDNANANVSSSLLGGTLLGTSYYIVAFQLALRFTCLQDFLGCEPIQIVNNLALACNAALLVVTAPTPILGVAPDTGYIVRTVLLLVGAAFAIRRAVSKVERVPAKPGELSLVTLLTGFGGIYTAGYAVLKFVQQPSKDSTTTRAFLVSLFNSIPNILKPMRDNATASPPTIALSLTDFLFQETAFGLKLSIE